jgi:excisionase family DNA binding protein
MPRPDGDHVDVAAAAAIAGRSAETVRRWVWSGRLRAHKRGNKLLIARAELARLLDSSGISGGMSLGDWIAALEKSGLKHDARRESAADLVLADRRARSEGRSTDARI